MLHSLINHNDDLRKLHSDGYDLKIKNAYLVISGIPYVNSKKELCEGSFVSTLELSGNNTLAPKDHVMHFIGEIPCDSSGNSLESIINSKKENVLDQELTANYSFSSKPAGGYSDYHHKVETYAAMLYSHAQVVHPGVTPKKNKVIIKSEIKEVHQYYDTNSSRSGVTAISEKLKNLKVAIIGLGGTGSYVLDLVAKTWVKEIHIFDGDVLSSHNAFRAPGAVPLELLNIEPQIKKTTYLNDIYSRMHLNIIKHDHYIDESSFNLISEMDFVFVCLDQGIDKKVLFKYLLQNDIPFIDLGIGVNSIDGMLSGSIRITTGTKDKSSHLKQRVSFGENVDDIYHTNIQLAELNSLNASLAVIKWKKMFGVYLDQQMEYNSTYDISFNTIINDETKT